MVLTVARTLWNCSLGPEAWHSPSAGQVVMDVLAEVLGGDGMMQQLSVVMEGTLAQHGACSLQAASVLDVSWMARPVPGGSWHARAAVLSRALQWLGFPGPKKGRSESICRLD